MAARKKFKKGEVANYQNSAVTVTTSEFLFRGKPHVSLNTAYGPLSRVPVTQLSRDSIIPEVTVEAPKQTTAQLFGQVTVQDLAEEFGDNVSIKLIPNEDIKEEVAVPNKYERRIYNKYGESIVVDVYDVIEAFDVTNSATAHAIKKALVPGNRGYKDVFQDLREVIQSTERAIHIESVRLEKQ